MLLNKEQVLKCLPHRDPFLFVDSVESVSLADQLIENLKDKIDLKDKALLVGGEVCASFFTREDHPIFTGHFPGYPILPGVVQIEMIAQASSFICVLANEDPFQLSMDVALMSVQSAKFRRPVLPGMNLNIKATCTRSRGQIYSFTGEIWNEGQLMSEAEFMAVVQWKAC